MIRSDFSASSSRPCESNGSCNPEKKGAAMSYRLRIGVGDSDGTETTVARGTLKRLPERIIRFLLGAPGTVLVLNPTQAIRTVEVHEIREDA